MAIPILALLAGLALLAWSANLFVDGSVSVSRNAGIAPIVVGLVVMGFGTSAPEILVSAIAAWQGQPAIALGNAIGSNISNLSLILGVAVLIQPITVQSSIVRRELPALLGATLFAWICLRDASLSRPEGVALVVLLAGIMIPLVLLANAAQREDPLIIEAQAEMPAEMSNAKAWTLTLLGLALLVLSSRMLVWAAVEIATALGVDTLVISLTIVAIGTSLPELAASVAAAMKGEADLALGNVVGSNLFNTLAVIGIAATVKPFDAPELILTRDFPLMSVLTMAVLVMAFDFRGPGRLHRVHGGMLLLTFVTYEVMLFLG